MSIATDHRRPKTLDGRDDATRLSHGVNQVTSDGVSAYTYDENGNRTSKGGAIFYTWDDENRLTEIADLASHTFRSTFSYDGLGRLRVRKEYTWNGSESEVAKSGMTLSGSGTCCNWEYAYAKNGLTSDPGWHNGSYTGTSEYLRVDLGSSRTVGHVAYEPRQMSSPTPDGSWNGAYRIYAIYVTDDSSGNPDNWGSPVATGEWYWPNLQERRDVYFTPKSGRYVYFRRITAWGWYTEQGYPGFASANEIWVYEQNVSWSLASETRYIYDGKRVIQERNSSNTPTVTYTRGKDLSGSLEGAGGIGGLLARSHGYSGGSWSTHSFYHADGNGNVTCLTDSAATPAVVASYKYDPYGRTISQSGSLASANVYRFSSKELHANSGLYYYLYRFYDPNLHRWLNRDPLFTEFNVRHPFNTVLHANVVLRDELAHLYGFTHGSPINTFDIDGLIAPVPIIMAGLAIGNCLIALYELNEYFDCMNRVREINQQAAQRLPEEQAIEWCSKNRGQECHELLKGALNRGLQCGLWGAGRLLLIKAGINPIFGGKVGGG